jgi:SAM-dependent methyltransferase
MDEWPGEERRRPPLSNPRYAVRAPLARWLESEAGRLAASHGRYRVLDVGCGRKPYLPFFAPYASEYVGMDFVENPFAELTGSVEAIPVDDGTFDVVLCTQVLEHCDDPALAVRELRRVLAPGGRVLASTHGVYLYHPSPQDLWRWTHAGLEKLFGDHADWASLTVVPGAGTAATIAMLVALYVELATKRGRLAGAGRVGIAALNRAGIALDQRSPRLRVPTPGTLFANYHVTADAPT